MYGAAGAAAIVAGTGPAIAHDHPDAELLELERRLEALIEPLRGTYARMCESGAEFDKAWPSYPDEELRYTAADRAAGLPQPETHGGGWCKWAIGEARQRSGLTSAALRRLDELEAVEARRDQEIDRISKACGHDQAIDAHDVLMDQADAICERAGEIEAQSLEGVAVKARIVAFQAWHLLFKESDWENGLLRKFMVQAMRLGSRDPLLMPWREIEPEGAQS